MFQQEGVSQMQLVSRPLVKEGPSMSRVLPDPATDSLCDPGQGI